MRTLLLPLKKDSFTKNHLWFEKKRKKKEEKIAILKSQDSIENMFNIVSSSRYKFDKSRIKKSASDYLLSKGVNDNVVVNLVFVGKNKMKKLSETYKKEAVALPVLSFPYNDKNQDEETLLGEVVVCYPQAVLLAAERNRKVEETITSLINHGIDNLLK